MRLYDLSSYWESNPFAEPWPPMVEWHPGDKQAKELGAMLNMGADVFQDSIALAGEHVHAQWAFHIGTHVDAPLHFGPMSEGKPSRSIDQLPLEDFYGDGVILDMRHKEPRSGITVPDLQKSLTEMNYSIKPKDIVLIMTGYDKHMYDEKYLKDQPGMTGEATEWLIDQGVKLIGIDAYTFDRPFSEMVGEFQEGNKDALFPAHFMCRKKEYYHIEKLANLDKVPVRHGFTICAFPIKVKDGSAGSARVVAIVEEDDS